MNKLLRLVRNPWLARLNLPPALVLICRLALWAAAFYVAYQGQMLLEDRRHLGRALGYMIVACLLIVVATFRQRLGSPAESPPSDLPSDEPRESVEPDGSGEPSDRRPESVISDGEKARTGLRRYLRPFSISLALLLLFVALGLGIAFRVYELPSTPSGVWFDEAQNGIIADRMIHDLSYHPVFITQYAGTNRPALPVYVFAIGVKLLGRQILALRSVSAVAGILTLIALFFLGRELFNARVGALATFLLAVMRWHLDFSRLAMEPIWGPFFAVSALFFLVRGVRRGRWYDFALSGLLLGLGLQFYWAFLLVPLLYAIYTAHSFVMRKSAKFVSLAMGALLVAVVGFLVYSPVAVYGYHHPQEYRARTSQVSITNGKNLEQTIQAVERTTRLHVLMFNSTGDPNGRHNIPGAPMLDTFTGIFFVLGLGLCLSRLWQPRYMLLAAWMVILLQPAIWSLEFEAPQALRAILVTPAVALLAALPLAALWGMAEQKIRGRRQRGGTDGERLALRRHLTRISGRVWRFLVVGGVALTIIFFLAQIARTNFHNYFDEQFSRFDVWASYSTAPTLVADEIKRLGPDYNYLMSSVFVGQPSLEFVDPPLGSGQQLSLDIVRDLPAAGDKPTVIFLDPDRDMYLPWIETLYPNATVNRFSAPGHTDPVALYEIVIPADQVTSIQGINATYTSPGASLATARIPSLDLNWSAQTPLPLPFDAAWSGVIHVREGKMFALTMQAPGQIQLSLDGQVVAQGSGQVQAAQFLYKGQHRLEVKVHVETPGSVLLSADGAPLPVSMYFVPPDPGHGLVGSFYANDSFLGSVVFQELDPFIGFAYHAELPFAGPLSVIWRGKIEAPTAGSYVFSTHENGLIEVRVDGQLVATNESTLKADLVKAPTLTQGLHDIEVRFSSDGGARVQLSWGPPDGSPEQIPSKYLYPP